MSFAYGFSRVRRVSVAFRVFGKAFPNPILRNRCLPVLFWFVFSGYDLMPASFVLLQKRRRNFYSDFSRPWSKIFCCFSRFVRALLCLFLRFFWSLNVSSVIVRDFGSVRSSKGRIRSDPSSTIYLLYLYRVYWIAQGLQGTLACKPPFTLVFSHLVIPSSCRDSLLLLSVLSSSRHDEFGFPLLFITSCHPSVVSSSWLSVFLLRFLRIRFFAHYYLRFVLSTLWGTKTRLSL